MNSFGSFVYLDGNIIPSVEDDRISAGEVSFYEVIRTKEGVPLFYDDHLMRLGRGISTRYDPDPDLPAKIKEGFRALVKSESFREINVRITVTYTGREYSIHICYVPSSYPTDEMMRKGAGLILFHAERFHPEVKLLNNRLRMTVDSELGRSKAYEALLVNREGYITEGSRSNVFFLSEDGAIQTAPDNMVLSGITREKVIGICNRENLRLVFRAVRVNDLPRFRSVFITGTSPMVLPVYSIDKQEYKIGDPLVETIRVKYSALVSQSIRDYKASGEAD
jgi:branched-chain amino acid aminotransferase